MLPDLPGAVRLFVVNALVGLGLGAAFTGALIALNIANLGHLILGAPDGWLAVLMLVWFFAITFGGVQIAIRVLLMAEFDEDPPAGRRHRSPRPLALRARAGAR